MKRSLITLTIFCLTTSFQAFGDPSSKGEMFTEAKTHVLSMIEKRIAALQEEKTCVTQAQSHDDMKKCRRDMKEDHEGFKKDREEFRESMKSKREEMKKSRQEKRKSESSAQEH